MGMHEFEAGADIAITALDKSKNAGTMDLRSMYHSVAKFTGQWDASLQHFHILSLLLKHRFTYAFPVVEHPDYIQYKAYFDSLSGYQGINRVPGEDWGRENRQVAMYCNPSQTWNDYTGTNVPEHLRNTGMIYFDAGSELWQRFVDAGKLTGADAVPPKEIPIEEVIAGVVIAAQEQGDVDIISFWYPLITTIATFVAPEELIPLKQNPHLIKIREIATVTEAYKKNNDYGATRLPSPDDFKSNFLEWSVGEELSDLFQWWYQPLRQWYESPEYTN